MYDFFSGTKLSFAPYWDKNQIKKSTVTKKELLPTSSTFRRNICNCIFSFTKITVTLFFSSQKTSETITRIQNNLVKKNSPWVDRPHDKMYEHFSKLFYATNIHIYVGTKSCTVYLDVPRSYNLHTHTAHYVRFSQFYWHIEILNRKTGY